MPFGLAYPERFELPTYCLEGSCSIRLSYGYMQKNGASDGNRTHATSLEGWNSTIELHSQIIISFLPSYNITLKMLCQYLFWNFFIFCATIILLKVITLLYLLFSTTPHPSPKVTPSPPNKGEGS